MWQNYTSFSFSLFDQGWGQRREAVERIKRFLTWVSLALNPDFVKQLSGQFPGML
jgi:hypothetical protein